MTHKSLEKGKVIFHKSEKWDYVSAILKVIFLSSSDEKLDFKVRRKKWCKYFFRQENFFLKMVYKQNVKRNNKFDMHLKGAYKPKKGIFYGRLGLISASHF